MSEFDLFTEFRARQQAAVVANQRAQLDLYGREFEALRERNRVLKREVRALRRDERKRKARGRSLVRRAQRALQRSSAGVQVDAPDVREVVPRIDERASLSIADSVGFIVNGELLRARFDSEYYAQQHGISSAVGAWDHYLNEGIGVGAAISSAHLALLQNPCPPRDRWQHAIKALKFRNPEAGLLMRQSVASLTGQFHEIEELIAVHAEDGHKIDVAVMQAIIARYVPVRDPRQEVAALNALCEPRSLDVGDLQPSPIADASHRWGVVAAALALPRTAESPDWIVQITNRDGVESFLRRLHHQVGATLDEAGTSRASRVSPSTTTGLGPQMGSSFPVFRSTSDPDLVDALDLAEGLFGPTRSRDLVEFQTRVIGEAIAVLGERRRDVHKHGAILSDAEASLVNEFIDPSSTVAQLWFESRKGPSLGGHDSETATGQRPSAEWISKTAADEIESALIQSRWPAGYVAWHPVRALSEEIVRHA